VGDSLPSLALQQEVERFLYHEAWLLDRRRFHDWLNLFTEDARYFMPVRENTPHDAEPPAADGALSGAIFNDDKAFLVMRVQRLDTGLAHSDQPVSRTRHLVTNVLIAAEDHARGEITVYSSFLVFQSRLESSEHLFAGEREDTLRRVDREWKIARRTISLDHRRLPRSLTTFF
jgi:dibenzofuran dioxygenase beta subunit